MHEQKQTDHHGLMALRWAESLVTMSTFSDFHINRTDSEPVAALDGPCMQESL